MSEVVEGGAALAWRLLATLEGGSLLLATSALLAYSVRNKIIRHNRDGRRIRHVLVTNTTNLLGRELKRRLEEHGCVVTTVSQRISDVTSGAESGDGGKFDAIVVVGADPKADGLDGMANLVSEDVYDNLRLLESISPLVHRGGYIAWACSRDSSASAGAFSNAEAAFDTVLQASLHHLATLNSCQPVWRRAASAERAARLTAAALLHSATPPHSRFSIRIAAHRVGEYVGRWLKIVT